MTLGSTFEMVDIIEARKDIRATAVPELTLYSRKIATGCKVSKDQRDWNSRAFNARFPAQYQWVTDEVIAPIHVSIMPQPVSRARLSSTVIEHAKNQWICI